jgi:hypothetical protein
MKPRIFFRDGYWRVSPCPHRAYSDDWPKWHSAHKFVIKLNEGRVANFYKRLKK